MKYKLFFFSWFTCVIYYLLLQKWENGIERARRTCVSKSKIKSNKSSSFPLNKLLKLRGKFTLSVFFSSLSLSFYCYCFIISSISYDLFAGFLHHIYLYFVSASDSFIWFWTYSAFIRIICAMNVMCLHIHVYICCQCKCEYISWLYVRFGCCGKSKKHILKLNNF